MNGPEGKPLVDCGCVVIGYSRAWRGQASGWAEAEGLDAAKDSHIG